MALLCFLFLLCFPQWAVELELSGMPSVLGAAGGSWAQRGLVAMAGALLHGKATRSSSSQMESWTPGNLLEKVHIVQDCTAPCKDPEPTKVPSPRTSTSACPAKYLLCVSVLGGVGLMKGKQPWERHRLSCLLWLGCSWP